MAGPARGALGECRRPAQHSDLFLGQAGRPTEVREEMLACLGRLDTGHKWGPKAGVAR